MNKTIMVLITLCILIIPIQVLANPHVSLDIKPSSYNIEIGDSFEVEFWIKNAQNVNVDTWMINISFSDKISAIYLQMSPWWLTKYHYNGTISNNKITDIQSHNPTSSNMNSLLFTVTFKAEEEGVCNINFDDITIIDKAYNIAYTSKDVSVGVGSSNYVPPEENDNIENTPPIATIGEIGSPNANTLIYFDAIGSIDDKAIISYDWDFGDNTSANGINVTHQYATEGEYTVMLTVKDGEGLFDTQTIMINVSFVQEEPNTNNNENNNWIYWVIIIAVIIIIVVVFFSKYEIEW